MNDESRYQRAVRVVWERSYNEYEQWCPTKREVVQRALDALLTSLCGADSEADLIRRYLEVGDAPGNVLRQHLPTTFNDDDLLVLEEAAFWMRLRVLRALHGER